MVDLTTDVVVDIKRHAKDGDLLTSLVVVKLNARDRS